MVAGTRTKAIDMNENLPCSFGGETHSVFARNLRKSDLGGVIFGCEHNTMAECLSKQLFGLPYQHLSYVGNIGAGLPLFLFNYTDRKLHGIYEAASNGQLYIDSYAWTDAGAERTPFPAQVYIRIRMQCQPLTEDRFKRIIEDNYFTPKCFWFELDHAQTRDLIASFKPSPPPVSRVLIPAISSTTWKTFVTGEHLNSEASKSQKNAASFTTMVNGNKFDPVYYYGNIKHASFTEASSADHEDGRFREPVSDWEDLAEDDEQNIASDAFLQLDGGNQTSQKLGSYNHDLASEKERVLCLLKKLAAGSENVKSSSKLDTGNKGTPCDPGDSHETKGHADKLSIEAESDYSYTASDIDQGNVEATKISTALDVIKENAEIEPDQAIRQLRNLVRDAGNSIQLLKNRVQVIEPKIDSSNLLLDSSLDKNVTQCLDDVVYLIGGSNGHASLSSLDSFSPSLDILTPLKSMNFARSYAASVALDGILFVIGGSDDDLWSDTVEYYDRWNDTWALCPSMLCEKGCLGGVALNGKIFAIGGTDAKWCFSNVEMFDTVVGKWLNYQPMIRRRFAHTTAELNGVIYAVGGFDEYDYLRSAEKIDPREGYWIELPGMKTRRACHSMAVFHEKLYCMGGYDSKEMVSSVEIYDPRMNSWMMGEPMKCARGYAAAAVFGDSLFAIGGAVDTHKFVDTVECYKEGAGWTTNDWKAIGKRSHLSAIVL